MKMAYTWNTSHIGDCKYSRGISWLCQKVRFLPAFYVCNATKEILRRVYYRKVAKVPMQHINNAVTQNDVEKCSCAKPSSAEV